MALDNKDLEQIETLVSKSADDIAVSIVRSFERLEERMDTLEAHLDSRFAGVEDRFETSRQEITDQFGKVRDAIRFEVH